MTCFVAQAELPPEVQAAIVLAEASDKACENHKFRPFRENKILEVGLEDYLKLTEICQAYSMGSSLRAVQNINKLEKQNFQNLGKLSADEKAKNIESRVFFLTTALVSTPLTLAEALIIVLNLDKYAREADKLKNKSLKIIVNAEFKKIKDKKEKIYERTINQDINLMLAEYKNSDKGFPKDIENFKNFITELIPYSKELQKNLTCLSSRTCKICGKKFEKNCTAKFKSDNADLNLEAILDKLSEGTDNFFKSVNRL
jgi:hypothetical protein